MDIENLCDNNNSMNEKLDRFECRKTEQGAKHNSCIRKMLYKKAILTLKINENNL